MGNYVPALQTNTLDVGASGSPTSTISAATLTANRAHALPDQSGTFALTSQIPGGGVTLDAAGLGCTPNGGQLSSAGAPSAPGTNAIAYAHAILSPSCLVTTPDPGQTLILNRNAAPIATFDATISGWTWPNSGAFVSVGAPGDVYTVTSPGGVAVGVVDFGIAPTA